MSRLLPLNHRWASWVLVWLALMTLLTVPRNSLYNSVCSNKPQQLESLGRSSKPFSIWHTWPRWYAQLPSSRAVGQWLLTNRPCLLSRWLRDLQIETLDSSHSSYALTALPRPSHVVRGYWLFVKGGLTSPTLPWVCVNTFQLPKKRTACQKKHEKDFLYSTLD